ncbi:5-bromo-4-chloroindolyl phosphate hydrolysis family protein [Mammaliicoccus stepanovicii]|uniref:5-bromo-4-chloroindolyl phosphate hydrolysis protein XpaC n=1 Tax=Mammaliicoccus stepanovicii TaxID=643214 RepID=A0A239ZCC1_9STAP|nr:5-bromo-4-chloroindolyl phosphate hydrolysis family protein [Mammaliicoccus stepanovicii]PNZ73884.1 5-bromo-4-chloroindolyl phosphate hydrolase [Mammaliicoccus stepanovicii]GGI42150.1 5-bromo-4-chloroindolyl phosphate hydrolysis protein [Mammaliicoccus stepanovicii]SNV68266.1 5-bromo-4-chloroindolyl phosphate hydrolysis protein XpaC [Mammaliicoccus stepanovicii]
MKYNLSYILGSLLAIPVSFIVFLFSIFQLDLNFMLDIGIFFGSYVLSFIPIQWYSSSRFLKEMGLTRREYRFIRKQLNEAGPKLKRLYKNYMRVRSYSEFKNLNEVSKLARTIYNTVRQSPEKFYSVESFFYSHLDNTVNLIDNYTMLQRMPNKSKEEKAKLKQTKLTIDENKRTLVADLKQLNESSYHQLDIEMELSEIAKNRNDYTKSISNTPKEKVNLNKKQDKYEYETERNYDGN